MCTCKASLQCDTYSESWALNSSQGTYHMVCRHHFGFDIRISFLADLFELCFVYHIKTQWIHRKCLVSDLQDNGSIERQILVFESSLNQGRSFIRLSSFYLVVPHYVSFMSLFPYSCYSTQPNLCYSLCSYTWKLCSILRSCY